MIPFPTLALFLFRVSLGCMMFYAGITKVLNPSWSPFGYLARAKTFPEAYSLLLDPSVLPFVTFANAWGLTLIGAALILGVGTRIASAFAIALMILYYFPVLDFPHAGEHSFIVDEHVIYAFGFLLLIALRAGRSLSLAAYLARTPLAERFPFIAKLIR